MDTPKSISLFYEADILTFMLRKRFKFGPLPATALFFFLINIPLIVVAMIQQTLFTSHGRLGLFHDFGWWELSIIAFNATFYVFLWLPDGITETITGLIRNKTLIFKENGLDNYIQDFYRIYSGKLWSLIPLCTAIPYVLFMYVPAQRNFQTWQTENDFSFWFVIFIWSLMFFMGITLLTRGVIVIYWLNKLFKQYDIDVRVLHPDNAGGLAPLGKFSAAIGYVIAIYAISGVIGSISESIITSQSYFEVIKQPFVLLAYLFYCVMAPVVFFAPLSVAHLAMKRAKDDFITQVSDQFEIEMSKIPLLLSSDADELKKGLYKIEELQKLHSIASKFPVWPFNSDNLIRFLSSVISPFVISFIPILIEKIVK
jgi:hypothetical protein